MRFSVIIPVYNAQNYIETTIKSIINQDIGFEKFIEIVLINDGSTDHSEYICKQFEKRFLKNIKYYAIDHSGVSIARNYGVRFATGDYINFTDADDKWDISAFRFINEQVELNPDIEVFIARMRFFEQKNYYPKSDFRFNGSEFRIDIRKHSSYVQMNCVNCFIKKENLKTWFDTQMSIAEDMLFINQILIDKKIYFLVRDAVLFYRCRKNNTSTMQNMFNNKEYYTNTIDKISEFFMTHSTDKNIYEYICNLIIYDLHWRLNNSIRCKLTYNEMNHYKKVMKSLAQKINFKIVLRNENINVKEKIKIILLKI